MPHLLTNASNLSPYESTILLRVHRINGELLAEVSDSVPHLTPEEVEELSHPYYRGKRRISSGVGLGLSICKRLAQLQGGKIWVERWTLFLQSEEEQFI